MTGDELEIQKFIARKLKTLGLKVDMWEPDLEELKKHPAYLPPEREYKNRPNVVGIYKGAGGGRSLLFNGHVDVIPAGPCWMPGSILPGQERWKETDSTEEGPPT